MKQEREKQRSTFVVFFNLFISLLIFFLTGRLPDWSFLVSLKLCQKERNETIQKRSYKNTGNKKISTAGTLSQQHINCFCFLLMALARAYYLQGTSFYHLPSPGPPSARPFRNSHMETWFLHDLP